MSGAHMVISQSMDRHALTYCPARALGLPQGMFAIASYAADDGLILAALVHGPGAASEVESTFEVGTQCSAILPPSDT